MSEKRYFSIYASRHSAKTDNKNIRLFQILDELEEEDNDKIVKLLNKENISTKFLSSDKNYLFNSILKSLNEYHNAKTNSLIIKDLIISIEILFYKGLFNECLKVVKFAEKLAKEIDHLVLILEILTWKKRCIGYALGIERAFEVNKEIATHTDLLNNYKEITLLYYDGYLLKLKNESKSRAVIDASHKTILQHPLMQDETNAHSFTSKIYWLLIYVDYYFLVSDKDLEYAFLTRLVNHMESNPFYASENPLDYVSVYSRLFANSIHMSSPGFFNSLNHLRKFPFKSQLSFSKDMINQRIFIITYISELEWYIHFQQFDGLKQKIDWIISELKNIITFIEPFYLIQFYYLVVLGLFSIGNYDKALDYVNFSLNNYKYQDRPNFYQKTEFLNILIHVELKNNYLVQNLIKKFSRKKEEKMLTLEYEVLKYVEQEMDKSKKKKVKAMEIIKKYQILPKENGYSDLNTAVIKWLANRKEA